MTIAIYGKNFKKHFHESITLLFQKLEHYNAKVLIYKSFYNFIIRQVKITPKVEALFDSHETVTSSADLLFSIGGDGTFLESITYVRDSNIPVVGINSGRLGFLAYISHDEIGHAIDEIFARRYTLEQRALMQLDTSNNLFGNENFGLNEVTVHKKDSASMITIHTYVNEVFLNSYWADGLIISTPTGSTAYSLSIGGPIVVPNSENFILSPIAPHNLTVRPMVLPDDIEIKLKVEGRSRNYLVSIDYRSAVFSPTTELIIKKAGFSTQILKLYNHNYFATLRNKLMWGADTRN